MPDSPIGREASFAPFRRPLLFLFGSALFWLLAGNLLALVAAIGLPLPGFFGGGDWAWAAYGRIAPAARTAWEAGWASLGALGIALHLAARGAARPRQAAEAAVVLGTLAWNLALAAGIAALLGGGSTGVPGLEMPRPAWTVLLVSFLLIAGPALAGLGGRPLSVSRLYLLGALVWFPVLLGVAGRTLLCAPVPGSAQPAIIAWFGHGFLALWLAPVALAAFYEFVPEFSGRPLRDEGLARFGFWTLMGAGGWAGAARLVDGPAPAWLASAGVAAGIALLVPALAVVAEIGARRGEGAFREPAARFLLAAAIAYVLLNAESFLTAFRTFNPVVRFTWWEAARGCLAVYGVFGFAFFGVLQAALPGVAGRTVRLPFWPLAIGLLLGVSALGQGGLLQGLALLDPKIPFLASVGLAVPFLGLAAAALGLLLAGHLVLVFRCIAALRGRKEKA